MHRIFMTKYIGYREKMTFNRIRKVLQAMKGH